MRAAGGALLRPPVWGGGRRRPADSESTIDPAVWRIAAVVALGSMTVALDMTIVNIALDRLTTVFRRPLSDVQWVVGAYLLAVAIVIPASGWVSRRFGMRRVMIAALALFTVGSALCGLARTNEQLIAFRVVQGLGGGLIIPVGQSLVASAAGPRQLGRVMGLTSMPIILMPMFGPTVGGLILDRLAWQWIFLINIPLGLIAVVFAFRYLPAVPAAGAGRFDVIGLLLLSVGAPTVVYGLTEFGSTSAISVDRVVAPVAGGIALMALFCWHAVRIPNPLLEVRLIRNRVYAWALTSASLNGAIIFGSLILWPLYFQEVRREDVFMTGLLAAAHGIGVCAILPWAGRLADRFGGARVALAGIGITVLGTVPLTLVTDHTSYTWLEITLFIRGLGVGLSVMPVTVAAFRALRPEQIADGSAQLNVLQRIGGALGTALLAVVLQQSLTHLGSSPTPAQTAHAFDITFIWTLCLCVLAIAPCAMLLRAERRLTAAARTGPVPY